MLVEFNISNYKSFHQKAVLSLVPAGIKDRGLEAVIENSKSNGLKAAVIYGANGSGKSNFLDAFAFKRWMVLNSARDSQSDDKIAVEPFRLNTDSVDKPSSFETLFVIEKVKYRYGFESNQKEIVAEWLFKTEKRKETPLFIRDHADIQTWKGFKEGDGLESKTRSNALFLSVVDQFNGELSQTILEWFRMTSMLHGIHDQNYFEVSAAMLESEENKSDLMEFIRLADLGIEDMKLVEEQRDFSGLDKVVTKKAQKSLAKSRKSVNTLHNLFDSDKKVVGEVEFSLGKEESHGTQKFFNIIGMVIYALRLGTVLVVDELNTRLHPLLTRKIVQLFNSSSGNPYGAQLVFSTHDTNLLDRDLLRRDQIYFTEKDQFNESHIYSLLEYKDKPRSDEAYEKNYIKGKYGAIPFIGNVSSITSSTDS